ALRACSDLHHLPVAVGNAAHRHCGRPILHRRTTNPRYPGAMTEPFDLARRHLAQVVEWSDDAIVSKDLNGTILSWNRAAERLFGYSQAEAIGQSIRLIIPADRQDE